MTDQLDLLGWRPDEAPTRDDELESAIRARLELRPWDLRSLCIDVTGEDPGDGFIPKHLVYFRRALGRVSDCYYDMMCEGERAWTRMFALRFPGVRCHGDGMVMRDVTRDGVTLTVSLIYQDGALRSRFLGARRIRDGWDVFEFENTADERTRRKSGDPWRYQRNPHACEHLRLAKNQD